MKFNTIILNAFEKKASDLLNKEEDLIDLGSCTTQDVDFTFLRKVVDLWASYIDNKILNLIPKDSYKYQAVIEQRGLTYEEFYYLTEPYDVRTPDMISYRFSKIHSEKQRLKFYPDYKYNEESYIKFILSKKIVPSFFFDKLRALVPYSSLVYNTIISGSIGSGKTTLIKNLIYKLYKDYKPGQVILDPQNLLADGVLKLKGIPKEDIVYIDPFLSDTETPVINFLELREGQDASNIALRLARMLSNIFRDDLSPAMLSLLRPCLTVLIEHGGYSISDLKKFMLKGENEKLIQMGLAHPDEEFRSTFRRFNDSYFQPSKDAIISRLDMLAQDRCFRRLTTGKSTIDLKQLLEDGKVVVFNLGGQMEQDTKEAFGKLIISLVSSIAFERSPQQIETCRRIFLHIDELQNFLTYDIIKGFDQSRQKKLHFIVAHQRIGQLKGSTHTNKEESFMDSLIGNSGVKAIGYNESPDSLNLYSKNLGIDRAELASLKKFHFRLRVRNKTDIVFKPSNEVNEKLINQRELEERKAYMLNEYYKPFKIVPGSSATESKYNFSEPELPDQVPAEDLEVKIPDEDF